MLVYWPKKEMQHFCTTKKSDEYLFLYCNKNISVCFGPQFIKCIIYNDE